MLLRFKNVVDFDRCDSAKVWNRTTVPISLSSLSDSTGGSGLGGEAVVGGGPQGQPPYMRYFIVTTWHETCEVTGNF